jgi:hypothetical protein
MSGIPAMQEALERGPWSEASTVNNTRTYLKNKAKRSGGCGSSGRVLI